MVRRQSCIPSYFSVYESQLLMDNEYSDSKLEAAEPEKRNSRFYLLYSRSSACETEYLTFPPRAANDNAMDSATHTTRLLSSASAKRFSCNVSKMAYPMRNRMVCDGYFGCPDDYITPDKGNVHAGSSLKRRKPVCILPWKKRQRRCPKIKKKRKGKNAKHETKSPKVDCVISSLERTIVSGIRARVHAAKHSQGTGTKSHPALFYSHFIGKGSSIPSRKICAPKKDPPCDGYFGCHGDGSMRGKAKGKRKPIPRF